MIFFGGAETAEEASILREEISTILSKAGFNIKKWRSSSSEVLSSIPFQLLEPLPTQELIDDHSAKYPKALGLSWDSRKDQMSTQVNLPENYFRTKRGVISDIARTFDILGWISPVVLVMKMLYRDLWLRKLDWDT